MKKHAILMIAFFNCNLIEETLKSLIKDFTENSIPYDIYVLENSSPKSELIAEMLMKYKDFITKHIRSDINNFANIIIDAFTEELIPRNYKYYSVTESDVILNPNAYDEAIFILKKYKFHLCSIDLSLENLPVKKFPEAIHWVPQPIVFNEFLVGPTGFQFIVFRRKMFLKYIKTLITKRDSELKTSEKPIQLIRDQLLDHYCEKLGITWVRTKKSKLLHKGWDLYLDDDNEYVQYKKQQNKDKDWGYTPGAKLTLIKS